MKKVVVGIISKKIDNEEKYLLVSSTRDFGEFSGFYYPPGGHADDNEDEQSALIREIKEELNLDIKPIKEMAVTPGDVPNQETHWWKCEIIGSDLYQIDKDEIQDARWFSKNELIESKIVWPATKNFFEKFII